MSKSRQGRMVSGLSAGGFGACRLAMVYPNLFCAAGLFSPAIYNPLPPPHSSARKTPAFSVPFSPSRWKELNYTGVFKKYMSQKNRVPMFITSGDDDDFSIELHAMSLYQKLRQKKHKAELRIMDGRHEWKVYIKSLELALPYLLSFTE